MARYVRPLTALAMARLVIIPIVSVGVLWLLPLNLEVERVALVVALMPSAATSAVLARRFGGDPDFAAAASLVTTVAAVVTVPLTLGLALPFWES